jgi:hypothetical protein
MAALFERPPAGLVLDGCEHGGIIIGAGVMQQRVFGLVYTMALPFAGELRFKTGCGPANLVSGGTVQSQTTIPASGRGVACGGSNLYGGTLAGPRFPAATANL